jgi:DNA-binding PadR family transcriptional regulator
MPSRTVPVASPAPGALTPAVFHILLALADGPRHGYAIMRAVERSSEGDVAVGPGTIYGTLARLEDAGLVEEVATADTGGRPRRTFALRPPGRDALRAETARLERLAALARGTRLMARSR